jgi:hypothetical protein
MEQGRLPFGLMVKKGRFHPGLKKIAAKLNFEIR